MMPGGELKFMELAELDSDFDPVDLPRLPHGFAREYIKAVKVNLKIPVEFEIGAVLSHYTDGIHRFTIMQIKTKDFRKVEELVKTFRGTRLDAILGRMTRGGISAEMLRRGWLATAPRGETTLVAAGSIEREEIATLMTRFLD